MNKMKDFVKKHKIPYAYLTEHTGYTPVHISKVLNGHRAPSIHFTKLFEGAIDTYITEKSKDLENSFSEWKREEEKEPMSSKSFTSPLPGDTPDKWDSLMANDKEVHDLGPTKAILTAYCMLYAGLDGWAIISTDFLADRLRVSNRMIYKFLKELEESSSVASFTSYEGRDFPNYVRVLLRDFAKET